MRRKYGVIAIAAFAISAAGVIPSMVSHADALSAVASHTDCAKATGPFSTRGTKTVQGNGKDFVSYGVTLSTPQSWRNTGDTSGGTNLDQLKAQTKAIADGWCGNTVRLQVEQDELVGVQGKSLNRAYLNYLNKAIDYAKSLGLVVVINDQTEPSSTLSQDEPLPTVATEAFWHQIDKVYANDKQVVYDLFNEPMHDNGFHGLKESNIAGLYNAWHNGGTFTDTYTGKDGKPHTHTAKFIGHQQLANYVRHDGAKNLFWVEAPENGANEALSYLVANFNKYRIHGDGPVTYEYHHTTTSGVPRTTRNWDLQFGDLVKKNLAPVVDGEWTNRSGRYKFLQRNGDSGQCWADGPTSVPRYLNYLSNLGVGMDIWTLSKGSMLSSNNKAGDYTTPNSYNSSWPKQCKNLKPVQGSGQLAQRWFNQRNKAAA